MDMERPWSDLPQGIIEIIVNKLHFVDQVRALAVCKPWHDCKDYVRSSDTLPWVISIQDAFDSESGSNSFIFKLIDPYSRQVIKVSKVIDIVYCNGLAFPLATKNGWLLIGGHESKVFMYNPFTDDYIHSGFSQVEFDAGVYATINVDPKSPNWELFMGATQTTNSDYLRIETYTRSGLTSWAHFHIDVDEQLCSMLYMEGNIYCLSYAGILHRYRVEDRAWDLLTSEFPEPHDMFEECSWLMAMNDNLVTVRMGFDADNNIEWTIFKLDWSKMCWVVENSLNSCAIYITGDIAFSTQLTNQYGEKLEGCKLFDYDVGMGFKCYSLSNAEGTRILQSEEYGWITEHDVCQFSFIEPPYFRS